MIHCSISESLTERPAERPWDCMTNTSAPRTDPAKRGRISPLAKSTSLGSPSSTPRLAATSWASAGWVRPVSTCSLRVGVSSRAVARSCPLSLPFFAAGVTISWPSLTVDAEGRTGSHPGAWREVGPGPDPRVGADLGVAADRGDDHGAPAHPTVRQKRARPDLGPLLHHGAALQIRLRVENDVGGQFDAGVHVC